ncbi:hypothetical protein B1F75_28160 [Pseudomonas syringae]|nr:hypothetical protein B1F71_01735 [Pseudomonas syringae]RXT88851.1 hypothetical protein B1F75_28160 [Pseudomonas syringae]
MVIDRTRFAPLLGQSAGWFCLRDLTFLSRRGSDSVIHARIRPASKVTKVRKFASRPKAFGIHNIQGLEIVF